MVRPIIQVVDGGCHRQESEEIEMKQKSFAHLGRKLCAAFMACAMVLSSFSVSAQAEETSTTSMPTVKSYEKTSGSFATAEQSRI